MQKFVFILGSYGWCSQGGSHNVVHLKQEKRPRGMVNCGEGRGISNQIMRSEKIAKMILSSLSIIITTFMALGFNTQDSTQTSWSVLTWSSSLSPVLALSLVRSLVKLPRLVLNLACNLKFRPLSCRSYPSSWNYTAVPPGLVCLKIFSKFLEQIFMESQSHTASAGQLHTRKTATGNSELFVGGTVRLEKMLTSRENKSKECLGSHPKVQDMNVCAYSFD